MEEPVLMQISKNRKSDRIVKGCQVMVTWGAPYTFTRSGSRGLVLRRMRYRRCMVNFSTLTGGPPDFRKPWVFEVNMRYLIRVR
jgi:hypothetical protein